MSFGNVQANPQTIEGRVVGIADGDTITLLDAESRQNKIRLDGIDAPEKGQPFGGASKKHLAELLANRQAVAECSKIDRYGRLICQVLVGNVDVGLDQVSAGMAWYFVRYSKELVPERRSQLASAEALARSEGLGLWSEPNPLPPWEWRDSKRRDRLRDPVATPTPGGASTPDAKSGR